MSSRTHRSVVDASSHANLESLFHDDPPLGFRLSLLM